MHATSPSCKLRAWYCDPCVECKCYPSCASPPPCPPPLLYAYVRWWVFGRCSAPILVIVDAQLLTLERRAALLWRGDAAGVQVVLVMPTLSPDDTRVVVKSLTFVAHVVQCLPTMELYVRCLPSDTKR